MEQKKIVVKPSRPMANEKEVNIYFTTWKRRLERRHTEERIQSWLPSRTRIELLRI